uniref:Uncharacterized protein n=1 Tax=Oryza rufipogon TaxID=4529 RepID=A0A0E0QGX3_ORYRU
MGPLLLCAPHGQLSDGSHGGRRRRRCPLRELGGGVAVRVQQLAVRVQQLRAAHHGGRKPHDHHTVSACIASPIASLTPCPDCKKRARLEHKTADGDERERSEEGRRQIAVRLAAVVSGSLMLAAAVLLEMHMLMGGLRELDAMSFSGFVMQHVVVVLAAAGLLLVALAGCPPWDDERRR